MIDTGCVFIRTIWLDEGMMKPTFFFTFQTWECRNLFMERKSLFTEDSYNVRRYINLELLVRQETIKRAIYRSEDRR